MMSHIIVKGYRPNTKLNLRIPHARNGTLVGMCGNLFWSFTMLDKALIRSIFRYDDGKMLYRIKYNRNCLVGDPAGTISGRGYLTARVNKVKVYLHRLVWVYHNGDTELCIDHINGIKSDNRIENLRTCTYSQNSANTKPHTGSTSKYKGVSIEGKGKWQVHISAKGVKHYLGIFTNEIDAAKAYNKKATEIHGDFARLNNIQNE